MSQRVLFIIGTGNTGGREGQLLNLARRLSDHGWQVGVVFLVRGGPIADALRDAGVPVWCPHDTGSADPGSPPATPQSQRPSRLTVLRSLVGAVLIVRRAARAHRPDIVHAMLPTSVWLGLPALVGLRPRPSRVAGVYGFTEVMHMPIRRLYQRCLRHADAVVCNAPHLAKLMSIEYGTRRERTVVIANGVDIPGQAASTQTQPPIAVVVANFHAYKGHTDLIRALALMPADVALTVHLCGSGRELETVRQLVQELGVDDRIVFVEPPANVSAELQRAQFAVHPSHTEGLSNAILEQLAVGLPVVACRVGGNPVLIADKCNGLLIPPADPVALAAAVTRLATNPELRVRMASAARVSAEQYGWRACTQAHIDLYARLSRGGAR